jgi:hypothetical protein
MSRERGTLVFKMDENATLALIRNKLGKPDADVRPDTMVVAMGKNGPATICREGVGWWADANGGIPINFYSGNYGSGGFVDVTAEELLGVTTEETMDLADFINSFGDRLETNFYLWQQYIKG